MFDKDWVGDVSAVQALIPNLTSKGGNWIEGSLGKFKFCAKVFAVGSDYGIKNGRISKIQVCDTSQEHWGFEQTYLNYDRGWDIRPNDPEIVEFINGLLEAFGDDKLDGDDLMWYDLYGYTDQEAFDNFDRHHLGFFDTMSHALDEGKYYIDDDDEGYAIVKAISNDSEEIEILRKGG